VPRPRRKRLSPSSRRASSGGLSSSLGVAVSTGGLPGRRPPRHPTTQRLSVSLTSSAGSSSSPPPSPSVLLDDAFPSPPVVLPDRAALDELRKSLRTPAFRESSDASTADGVARKKANDWSTFDVDLHVALIDYTLDRLVDCRNTLFAMRDMSSVRPLCLSPFAPGFRFIVCAILSLQQVRELYRTDPVSVSPVGTLDDSFDVSPSPVPSEAPAIVRYFCKSLYQLEANLSCFVTKDPAQGSEDSSLHVFDSARKTWWSGVWLRFLSFHRVFPRNRLFCNVWTGALEHFRLRCAKVGFQDVDSDDD
jgi:hypothetical protein